MRNRKSWMIAGAVAGLLVAHGVRAAEDPGSAPDATASPSAPAGVEGVRPGTAAPATSGYGSYGTGSGSAGAGAGDPASPSDAGIDAARARAPSAAERAAQFDAAQVAAGNTGGRG